MQQPVNPSGTNKCVRVFDVVTDPTAPALMLDCRNASVDGGTLAERRKRSENPAALKQAASFPDSVTQAEMKNLPPPATRRLPTIQQEAKSAVAPFENTPNGSNQIATIKCNNKPGHSNAFDGFDGDDATICNYSTFQLNRALITLPIIYEIADNIYNRKIPNPGGDCNLINNAPNDLNVPQYNLTITGQPVAIACNVSASEVIDGTVIPLDPTSNQTPTNVSSANSSTNGLAGHQLSIPPPTPFAAHLNSTIALCLNGQGGVLCLPAGTHDTAANPALAAKMAAAPKMGPNRGGAPWNASLPDTPVPPVICPFIQSNHNGDVRCYGPGGGALETDIVNRRESIAVHGNAMAEIYAQEYGDAGGASVTADIMDLTDEIYRDGSFNQKVVALRVCDGSCAAGQMVISTIDTFLER
ncbi:MAG: hypothetical protein Q9161_000591 [Pseudevernia consocians]